jgi:hypothetical protein
MKEYHKIQGLFKRGGKQNKFIEGEWSLPEFKYLAGLDWFWTEKVDGTNMRVMFDGETVRFGGKTDRAQLHADLIVSMTSMFPAEKMTALFPETFDSESGVCLYGEGYGAGIQKGMNYRKDKSFVLFDVKVGPWWLMREDVEQIASDLEIDVVPHVDTCPILPMLNYVREGIQSTWGEFESEGVVGVPVVPLFARNGERVITKITTVSF